MLHSDAQILNVPATFQYDFKSVHIEFPGIVALACGTWERTLVTGFCSVSRVVSYTFSFIVVMMKRVPSELF